MKSLRNAFRDYCPGIRELTLAEVGSDGTLLDLGCGVNSVVQFLPKSINSTGVDIYKPSILQSKARSNHDHYINEGIFDALAKQERRSFDYVIAMDVIEHMEKPIGYKLLDEMERVARKKVIIFTPNGFLPQEDKDNPWQKHISGWYSTDFTERGYRMYGANGLKYLRGPLCEPVISPKVVGKSLALLSELIVRKKPALSYHLFAVSDIQHHA